jgi:NADP-dependent 3-hydroxy acid dehydrogenase YdfG
MRGVNDKMAIVTGAAHGIDRASAERLASAGVHVVAVDIDEDAVAEVARESHTESAGIAGDVSSEADTAVYLALAVERFRRMDLLHLNAGISVSFARRPDLRGAPCTAVGWASM